MEREWLELCAGELSRCGLLAPTADGGRSLAPCPCDHAMRLGEAFGCLLGYVLVHERVLPINLEAPFLRMLLNRSIPDPLAALESVDPVYAKSLRAVLDADDVASLGLTWTAEEGGGDADVTAANKAAFVEAAATWRLHGRIAGQIACIRKGLHSIVPRDWLAILTENDLGVFIAGVRELDIADWRRNTRLDGFAPDAPVVTWFWRCVSRMSVEERGLLLRLATGSSICPPGGFAELQGLVGLSPFTLQAKPGPIDRLPTASTCFNTLSLPMYLSYEMLERKLLAAVRFGSGGFEFV